MPEVDLLVLASSRKHGGRCVAGWDVTNDRWLRPVSSRADGTLELTHCAIDGDWPQLFDVVRVEVDQHRPTPYQSENWMITDQPWQRLRQVDPRSVRGELRGLVDHGHWMLQDGDRRVDAAALRASPAPTSLALVEPSDLTWYIEPFMGSRQYKTNFRVAGGDWCQFSVTDPPIHERLVPLPDGSHLRNAVGIDDGSDLFLLVSLSEPYDQTGNCYKLIAGVLEVPNT
jgi:hypothetical protein